MPRTESTDVPIRKFMVRSTTWDTHSSSHRHRLALVLALIVAAIVLVVIAPRARGDELSDSKPVVKKFEQRIVVLKAGEAAAKAAPAAASSRSAVS